MADFTTAKTWSVGDTLPAADMNTYVRDNVQHLYDNAVLLIDEYEVATTDVQTITFDSISQDFSTLRVEFVAATTHSAQDKLVVRANNALSTDSYTRVCYWYILNSGVNSAQESPHSYIFDNFYIQPSSNAGQWQHGNMTFSGYSNTSINTYGMADFIDPQSYIRWFHSGIYNSTDAVTRLDFIMATGNFEVGSKISLYGYR